MVLSSKQGDSTVITLLPNRSASWAETRVFIAVICATTLIIGAFWTFVGAWMVLPFSGLEAALFAFLMYRVCQATYQRQVITCTPQNVLVQFGTHFPKRTWTLERERAHLAVVEASHALQAPTLRIADADHSIELGHFLNKDDKEEALQVLKGAGLYVRSFNSEGRMRL